MTMLPRAGSLRAAAGAANADAAGNPPFQARRAQYHPAGSNGGGGVMRRPWSKFSRTVTLIVRAADCSIRTAKLKAVGCTDTVAACGCGKLPNRRGRGANIGLARRLHRECSAATHWREITGCERRFAP